MAKEKQALPELSVEEKIEHIDRKLSGYQKSMARLRFDNELEELSGNNAEHGKRRMKEVQEKIRVLEEAKSKLKK